MINNDTVRTIHFAGYDIQMALNAQIAAFQRIAGIIAAERAEIIDIHAFEFQICTGVLVREIQSACKIKIQLGIRSKRCFQFDAVPSVRGNIGAIYRQCLDCIFPLIFHRIIMVCQVMTGDFYLLCHPYQRLG